MTTRAAYCLLIDGIDVAFWTDEDAAAGCSDTRNTSHLGLRHPQVGGAIDLRTGQILSGQRTFTIDDVDGTLADLFAVERDYTLLETNLGPRDTAGVALYSKHVGVEQIGAAGQRKRFPALVGDTLPIDHVADGSGPGATPVSDDPVVWYGRRCVLYRVVQNTDGTWPALAASMRLWWGVIEDAGTVRSRSWTISASGMDALLRRELNIKSDHSARRVGGRLTNPASQRAIGILAVEYDVGTDTNTTIDTDDYASTWTDEDDIRSSLNAALAGITWLPGQSAGCSVNGIWVQADVDIGDLEPVFVTISMHRDAWAALGYVVEGPEKQSGFAQTDPRYLEIYQSPPEINGNTPPDDGYVACLVSTKGPGDGDSLAFYWMNNGGQRLWEPSYPGGLFPLKAAPGPGQVVKLETDGPKYVEPQQDRPPAADPDDSTAGYGVTSGDVDSQRLWYIVGKRRQNATSDEFEYAQIARMSWRSQNFGGIDDDEAVITAWLDPLAYGAASAAYTGDWMVRAGGDPADRAQAYPLAHFSTGTNAPALRALRSLLLSSGTSGGWYTSDAYTTPAFGTGVAYLEPGDNDPGDSTVYDRERADFGLSIPAELVGDLDDWIPAIDGLDTGALQASIAVVGPVQSEELIAGIMQPRGWAWSLRGGKYSPFVPWHQSPTVDVTITPEDMVGAEYPGQSLRVLGPVSRVTIEHQRDPLTGTYRSKTTIPNYSGAGRYGPGGVEHTVKAWGMGSGQVGGLISHWAAGMAWWSKRHFEVSDLKVPLRTDIWPGTRIALTDPRLVAPSGSYGVTSAIGYVTAVEHDTASEVSTLTCLVVAAPAAPRNRCGPSALVVGINDTDHILYIDDDWLGVGGSHQDANGFDEPTWSTAGGNLGIEIWQWDGTSWSGGVTATVASVSTNPPALVLTGAWTGTLYRDTVKIAVAQPFADQGAAWAVAQLCAVADKDGEVDGNTANAGRWG